MEKDCCETQLICGDGDFNAAGLDKFVKSVKLSECGLSYAVVAIMGPQSSGKSTLLNHLFLTNFTEMDAFRGRNQTTKGIWIAKAVGIEPLTVVLDLEGTDGRERGEDDTAFEKRSALFALAIADIVLINIWCHDIGREHAANKPLLKTVFQVIMRLFSPRRTTLLFVIRDKTKTPLERLELVLREDIQKIWDSVSKPEAHKNTPLSEFFNVQVTALSSYEEKEEQFKEQVAQLRKQFFNSIDPGGLAGDRRGVVPASGFSYSAQQIWEVIKENKDLDLPAHKVMVATVRCEEIANDQFNNLLSDEHWLALEDALKSAPVSGFGKQLSSILDTHLSEYDMEAMYFDEGVRGVKRQQLKSKLLQGFLGFNRKMEGGLGGSMGSIHFSGDGVDLSGQVHHLPCCIKHTGPSDVSHYFKPKNAGNEVDDLVVEEASFRGRKLLGTSIPIPEGYSGFIIGKKNIQNSKDKKASARDKSSTGVDTCSNDWEVLAKSQNISVWNHDNVPSKDDAFIRSFHWLTVASALHEPVGAEDLAAGKSQ